MSKKILLSLLAGFVIGALWLVAVRFVLIKDDTVHYHANFALYINGEREEFESPLYFEEVQSCTEDSQQDPKGRAHLHNQENSIVHIHDHAATWGHFMANLGYGLSNNSLNSDKGVVHVDGQHGNLRFVLNGEVVDTVANRVIGDSDVLLISFGTEEDQKLMEYFDAIPTDAHQYNDELDPAGCSGSEPLTFWTRLKKSFAF